MQKSPDRDMVLIHDDDLQTIDRIGDDTVSGIFEYHFYCSLHVCSYRKAPNIDRITSCFILMRCPLSAHKICRKPVVVQTPILM